MRIEGPRRRRARASPEGVNLRQGSAVLVLNSLYQAVQVTGVRRAFRLFYGGRARALAPDFSSYDFENWCDLPLRADERVIQTPSRTIRIPRVIQLVVSKRPI